jgi:type IV pilus assembly protein PilP
MTKHKIIYGSVNPMAAALVAAVILAVGGVGCGSKETPHQAAPSVVEPPTAEQTPAKPAAATPEVDIEATYTYRAEGRRDPFVSLIRGVEVAPTVVEEESGPFVAVVEGGNYSPLARFDLQELKLVGIIDVGGVYHGLVEVADGKSYFLRSGTRVGRNGGVVSRVLEDRVVVTETYRNPLGETRTKDVYLTFAKTGGD